MSASSFLTTHMSFHPEVPAPLSSSADFHLPPLSAQPTSPSGSLVPPIPHYFCLHPLSVHPYFFILNIHLPMSLPSVYSCLSCLVRHLCLLPRNDQSCSSDSLYSAIDVPLVSDHLFYGPLCPSDNSIFPVCPSQPLLSIHLSTPTSTLHPNIPAYTLYPSIHAPPPCRPTLTPNIQGTARLAP